MQNGKSGHPVNSQLLNSCNSCNSCNSFPYSYQPPGFSRKG
jgi:hypothetical protein